jgi:hypothetical protein
MKRSSLVVLSLMLAVAWSAAPAAAQYKAEFTSSLAI